MNALDAVKVASALRDDATKTLAEASAAETAADEQVQRAQQEHFVAKQAHDASASEGAAIAESAAGAALARARRLHEAAKQRTADARGALSVRDASLALAKSEVRKGQCETAASPATLAAVIAKPSKAILDAMATLRSASAQIADALAASHAASAELRDAHKTYTTDLDGLHAILPMLFAAAERGEAADLDLNAVRNTTSLTAAGFIQLTTLTRPASPSDVDAFKANLRRLAVSRTLLEAGKLESAEIAERQAKAPSYTPPTPAKRRAGYFS